MPLILLLVAIVVAVVVVVIIKKKGSAEPDHQFIDVSDRLAAPRPAATPDVATRFAGPGDDAAETPAAHLPAAPETEAERDDAEPDDAEPDLSRFGVVPEEKPRVEIPWPTNAPVVAAHPMEGPLPTLDLSDPRPGDGATSPDPVAAEAVPSAPATTGPVPDAAAASDAGDGVEEPEASVGAVDEVATPVEVAAAEGEGTATEQRAGSELSADEPAAVPSTTDATVVDEPAVADVAVEDRPVADLPVEDLPAGDVVVMDEPVDVEPVVAAGPEAASDDEPDGGEADTAEVAVDAGLAADAEDATGTPAEGATGTPAEDDAVIDLVAREAVGREPAPEEDPVDMVLNALISRARERHVGVAEVAAELVEQAEIEDREVDEVLAELVGWSEDGDDAVRTADRLSELTLFNDAVPTRPGELSQFERLASTEKKRVIIRVLCLLVAQSGDRVKPREPRSEAETRGWPLARAVWPVPVDPEAAEPEGDLPARPVARSAR
jgi:hypothetical protein